MLKEYHKRKKPGEENRRWFTDDDMDLILWTDGSGAPRAFQLCYGKSTDEFSVSWSPEAGYHHRRVDPGDLMPDRNDAPMLGGDTAFNPSVVAAFRQNAAGVEAAFVDFVCEKLRNFRLK